MSSDFDALTMEKGNVPHTHSDIAGARVLVEKFDRLLAKTKPAKRENTRQHLAILYPRIEAYLAKGGLFKDVLAKFNEVAGTKLCARTFKGMLENERRQHTELNSNVFCTTCKQQLPPKLQRGGQDYAETGESLEANHSNHVDQGE